MGNWPWSPKSPWHGIQTPRIKENVILGLLDDNESMITLILGEEVARPFNWTGDLRMKKKFISI